VTKFKQKRIKKIIHFMDHLRIPVECGCEHQHKLVISDFEVEDCLLVPKRTIRLNCAKYYEFLEDIDDIKLDIKVDAQGSPVPNFMAKVYIELWKIWLNW